VQEQPNLPPVRYLDVCTPGPACDYGAAYQSFQTWGNVFPNALGDCSFAAAANWEQIVLGVHADPSVIESEFGEAAGTAPGITLPTFWSYWQKRGIAGVYLKGIDKFYTDATDVENGVRDYGAMFVSLSFTPNDGFGWRTVEAGRHDVVVIGFTPEGPLVVSWGETLQMTWEQWNYEVVGMWGIPRTDCSWSMLAGHRPSARTAVFGLAWASGPRDRVREVVKHLNA
jgi:hypothetical protein